MRGEMIFTETERIEALEAEVERLEAALAELTAHHNDELTAAYDEIAELKAALAGKETP